MKLQCNSENMTCQGTAKSNTPRSTPVVRKKYRNASSSFKSPRSTPNDEESKSEEQLKIEIEEMKKKEEQLDKEIEELQELGYQEEELKLSIEKLHDYNEMKDIGQMLLGQIANQRGLTVRSLYEEYGLSLED